FGVAFIAARLLFSNSIGRWGGYRVSVVCLGVELLGLLLIWLAPGASLVFLGAALTGLGLSLLYPALAVEVIQQVPASSRSAALGAFALFFDLALGVAGPLLGVLIPFTGLAGIFAVSALFAVLGLGVGVWLLRGRRRGGRVRWRDPGSVGRHKAGPTGSPRSALADVWGRVHPGQRPAQPAPRAPCSALAVCGAGFIPAKAGTAGP